MNRNAIGIQWDLGTGFFPDDGDEHFVDPEGPLLSDPVNAPLGASDY